MDSDTPSLSDQFKQTAKNNGIEIILTERADKIPTLIKNRDHREAADHKICIAPVLRDLPWDQLDNVRFGSNDGSYTVGISRAQAGISQTGALVLVNDQDNPASICFLSREHVVVLYESEIRASAADIWNTDFSESNAVHFIAGPSSTADIGGKLLIGVHGPEKVICILISD